ncbi:MAG: putative hydroxymethylpyrimidine transporter CytX [Synergistaceae bacterium]|nr:putative hydroxymethylpyrimidine transporter CytX [Synergistaceae bacterium]
MNEEKRSTAANALIWFGAAVSIAEIYTGTLMAPLGMARGMAAVVAGHLIGGFLMYLAALIGGLSGRGAMESVKLSFGEQGAKIFALLNVLQLVGWTAVMIIGGALSLGLILNPLLGTTNLLWCGVIGLLIAFWVMLDMKNFERVNKFAMAALFILTVVLSFVVFSRGETEAVSGTMSFAEAMELSVAMPLSWLPLIADYMRDAKEPRRSAAVSTLFYSVTSCWMYFIGLGVAIYTGGSGVAQIMAEAGLGMAGVAIVLFSTVTTTFLDAYSGGISFHTLFPQIKEKAAAVAVCALGTYIAATARQESYEGMLYLISSVFAPMASVMIVDFFILRENYAERSICLRNVALWAVGFAFYRLLLTVNCPFGATLPVIAATMLLTWAAGKLFPRK